MSLNFPSAFGTTENPERCGKSPETTENHFSPHCRSHLAAEGATRWPCNVEEIVLIVVLWLSTSLLIFLLHFARQTMKRNAHMPKMPLSCPGPAPKHFPWRGSWSGVQASGAYPIPARNFRVSNGTSANIPCLHQNNENTYYLTYFCFRAFSKFSATQDHPGIIFRQWD